MTPPPPLVLPAVLGWSNTEVGCRMYALDKGPSPRWHRDGRDPNATGDGRTSDGRTIEYALRQIDGTDREGDRYLIIRLGDRFVDDARAADLTAKITALLEEA